MSGRPTSHVASDVAVALTRLIAAGSAPAGSLRVFGDWFGRPYDNQHRPVTAAADGTCLTVEFDGGETLEVWEPSRVTVTEVVFEIRAAARVRWAWFSYGDLQIAANRWVEEHRVEQGGVVASSTASWRQRMYVPSPAHAAVELL